MKTRNLPMDYRQLNSVCVVIPAYNSAATIRDAVASARAQSHRPAQIVVVDDASQDDTVAQLHSVAASDLIVVSSAMNRGGSAARNRGIEHTTADVVAFLDADDLWAPDKLERQLGALRAQRAASFCFNAVVHTNEYGEKHVLPRRAPRADESLADYMLRSGNVIQTSTLLVPRHLLRHCRFNEALRRFQDIDFVLRLAAAGARPVYVPHPLTEWRNTGNMRRVSANPDPDLIRTFVEQQRTPLSLPQRLGLEVRSFGPAPGAAAALGWSWRVLLAVGCGALAVPNAVSLLLKHGLGPRQYGALRSRLGVRS